MIQKGSKNTNFLAKSPFTNFFFYALNGKINKNTPQKRHFFTPVYMGFLQKMDFYKKRTNKKDLLQRLESKSIGA